MLQRHCLNQKELARRWGIDAHLAQEMSDRAVAVVRASEAGEWLPRAAAEPTAVLCRGGMAAGKWHAPCAWAKRCWGERR